MKTKLFFLTCIAVVLISNNSKAQTYEEQQNNYIKGDSLEKAGAYSEAAETYEKAAILSADSAEQNLKLATRALSGAGGCYYQVGQFDKAIDNFQRGLKVNRKLNNEMSVATSLNNVGMVYKAWGNFDKALEFYQQALEIDQKNNDKAGMSTDFNNIGGAYYNKGMNEKALEFYRKALKLDGELQNPEKIDRKSVV